MENFVINDKTYRARDIDFEFLVALDKAKIDIENISGIAAVNCYFTYCSGMNERQAAAEITQHIIKGGDMGDIGNVYAEKVSESDFFRALMGTAQNETAETASSTNTTESTKKKTTKKQATD